MKISQSVGAIAPGTTLPEPTIDRYEDAELPIHPPAVARTLAYCVAVLVLASLAGQAFKLTTGHDYAGGFIPKFNLDAEDNVPTFFSALLLVGAAGLLTIIGTLKKKAKDTFALHWFTLAALFLFLGTDEASSIHETLIMPLRTAFKAEGIFHYAWVIAAIPLVILFMVGFAKFFFHLPRRFRLLLGLAVGTYITGALGLELIGGWYAARNGLDNWGYVLLTTIEETLEMAGVVVLIYGLLEYLKQYAGQIRWSLHSTS
ncbi:MAG: hypothetical protein ACAH95_10625 [Fimbriimonas sp.]